ncbi:MAG: peptidase S10 [Candidatus Saccharicenans sp.]|jgi:carboxypeptidase C (cathepsin A)|nr:peptidase S10 [Candidatus Saccharicenans sp.]MDH7492710.1 peptidase S10 [Candidatus Saccharicenans sp.]
MRKEFNVFTALMTGLIVLVMVLTPALAQTRPGAGSQPQAQEAKKITRPEPRPFSITTNQVVIEGKVVPYKATAGELTVLKQDETPGASMFFVAYTRDDVKDKSTRPVMFCFNGGPGSSTVWLHLGGIGPKRVAMDEEGYPLQTPAGVVDSDCSLLDLTDLVFVDAVSTGYSRPLPGEAGSQFHGVEEDGLAFAEFIRIYLTTFDRWSSPKFLLGESYGTTRAAVLSGVLQNRTYGIYLNGIVLLSSVLDFATLSFNPGNNLSYMVFLPHYTATAWYHKKLPEANQKKELTGLLQEAREFAVNEYLPALIKGNLLTAGQVEAVARKMSELTGLSVDYLKNSNLRVRHDRFVKELLRDRRLTVGRLDSRFTGRDADAAGESYEYDPSSALIMGPFSAALNNYVGTVLNYKKEVPYAIYGNVYPWNFNFQPGAARVPGATRAAGRSSREGSLYVAETLRQAMAENTALKIFCCNGYYDGATPFFGTEYTFSQLMLDGSFKDRVRMGYYQAGHMMYIHKPSLKKLRSDLAAFITWATK